VFHYCMGPPPDVYSTVDLQCACTQWAAHEYKNHERECWRHHTRRGCGGGWGGAGPLETGNMVRSAGVVLEPFYFHQKSKFFKDSTSYQIFKRIHRVLNIN